MSVIPITAGFLLRFPLLDIRSAAKLKAGYFPAD